MRDVAKTLSGFLQFTIYEPLVPFFGATSILYSFGYTFLLNAFFTSNPKYEATLHKLTMTEGEYQKAHKPAEEGYIKDVKKLFNPIYTNKFTNNANGVKTPITDSSTINTTIDTQYTTISEKLTELNNYYQEQNKNKSEEYQKYSIIGKISVEIKNIEKEKALLKALVNVQTKIDTATATVSNYRAAANAAITLMKADDTLKRYIGNMQVIQLHQDTIPDQKAKQQFSEIISNLINAKKQAIGKRLSVIYSAQIYRDKWEFDDKMNYLRLPAVGLGFFKFYYYDWTKLIAAGFKLPVINLWITNIDLGILPAFALRYYAISLMSKTIFGKEYNFRNLASKGLSDFAKILSFVSQYTKVKAIESYNYLRGTAHAAGNLPDAINFSLTVKELAILSVQTAFMASTSFMPVSTSMQALLTFHPVVAQGSAVLSGVAFLLENADHYLQGAISNARYVTSGLAQTAIASSGILAAGFNLAQGNIPATVMIAIGTTLGVLAFRQAAYLLEKQWSASDIAKSITFNNFAISGGAFGIPMVVAMYVGAPVTGLAIGATCAVVVNLFLQKAEKKSKGDDALHSHQAGAQGPN